MQKFVFKFFILLTLSISLMFFSLIFLQKNAMEKEFKKMAPPQKEFMMRGHMPPPGFSPLKNRKEPPLYIPLIAIISLSSILIYLLLSYLDKNFISPFIIIQKNLKDFAQGAQDIKFVTKSENKNVLETFSALNGMMEDIKQKEKLQENFIQNLAHDLRGPILAQERAIEILQDEFNNHELLEGLMENSEKYLKMINLIIEAYNRQEFKIEKTEFDLCKMSDAIIKTLIPQAKEKNIKIINQVARDFIIWGDYLSINRIIVNLIINSIESIPSNKEIFVKSKEDRANNTIIIEDNGQGIPKDKLENIFKKHVCVNKTGKKAISGLGLTIVKELVEKHEGNITVQSEENMYTRFIINLPKKEKNEKTQRNIG